MLSPGFLDGAALSLITHDVLLVPDADLVRATPCAGWSVADLLDHMCGEHEAFTVPVLGAQEAAEPDPRQRFAVSAARWTLALARMPGGVTVPGLGAISKDQVQSVHFIDMLTHRWDLARALGRPCPVDRALTSAALPIARRANHPGSPLHKAAYQPGRPDEALPAPMDQLAAVLGRDPGWSASR